MRRRLLDLLPSVASGLLLALAQPPYGLGWLAFVALVPFLLAAEKRRSRGAERGAPALAGYVLGLSYFGGMLYWIAFLPGEEMTLPMLRVPAVAAMVLYLSLFGLLFAVSLDFARVRGRIPLWLAAPALWAGVEWLRGWGPLGLPWGSLGYALTDHPAALQAAAGTGLSGLSAWIVLGNVAVVSFVGALRREAPTAGAAAGAVCRARAARRAVLFWGLLWIPLLAGRIYLDRAVRSGEETGRSLRIALVQPNVGGPAKWRPDFREWNLHLLETMTVAAAGTPAELVIWPETAATSYLRYDGSYRDRVVGIVNRTRLPLVTGFLDADWEPGGKWTTYNAAGLFLPGAGLAASYRKMHLVPFGEMIPGSSVVPWLGEIDLGEADFSPGREATVLRGGPVPSGVLICFESIFPQIARRMAAKGAGLLVNITNDSWFGDSPAPRQHAAMAIVRAVELRRPLARAANTGISLLVDPWGRVRVRSGVFTREVLAGSLPLVEGRTFYARWGGLVDAAYPVAAALVLLWAAAGRGRRARHGGRARRAGADTLPAAGRH